MLKVLNCHLLCSWQTVSHQSNIQCTANLKIDFLEMKEWRCATLPRCGYITVILHVRISQYTYVHMYSCALLCYVYCSIVTAQLWNDHLYCMCLCSGYTGLHLAGAWGHLETLKALISNGANPSLVNVRNETPCNVAERYGNQDCVEFLQAAGL